MMITGWERKWGKGICGETGLGREDGYVAWASGESNNNREEGVVESVGKGKRRKREMD